MMAYTPQQRRGGAAFALAILAIGLAIALACRSCEGAKPRRYWRSEGKYTIRHGGDCFDVAKKLDAYYDCEWDTDEHWLVAHEIAFINHFRANNALDPGRWLRQGTVVAVPIYRQSGKAFSGSIRNWHCAVIAGRSYHVSPALLVAVRSHENPKASRDWYGYGVKHLAQPRRTELNKLKKAGWSDERITRFQHHFLWEQADGAAKIIRRIAGRQKWSPMKPTPDGLLKLGKVYTGTRSTSWGPSVWEQYQKARGR